MTEEMPAPRERKGLLAFYVGMSVILALIVAGGFAYRPLKLRYAIYRVEENPYKKGWADRWLMHCVERASAGNRRALGIVLDHHDVVAVDMITGDSMFSPSAPARIKLATVAYVVGRSQPNLLMDALSERNDRTVLDLIASCHEAMAQVGHVPGGARPEALKMGLEKCLPTLDPRDERLARSALDLLNRRFAKQFTDAEKRKAGTKK